MLGWILVNIALPVAMPILALMLVSTFLALTKEQKERSRFITTVEDGQLGWLAAGWSAATIYEGFTYMDEHPAFLSQMSLITLAAFLLMNAGMFVATGGAVTDTGSDRPNHRILIGSIITSTLSALLFIYVHAKFQ